MSLVQVWLENDRARVAVDTLYTMPGVGMAEGSKLLPLPHAGTVFAYRGAFGAFALVFAYLYVAQTDSFDSIIAGVPNCVLQAKANLHPDAAAWEFELHVVGYSDELQRFSSMLFLVDLKAGTAEAKPLNGPCRVGPAINPVPELNNDAAMFEVARAQVAWMRDNEPELATGGRLLIAELTRAAITVKQAGQI
jgi:hypothetical protein